ncbi:MAG: right-handed parallel beta-helix repeat-containing protein [Candidatus Levybacteria bacterium]|nr:right-handed parallel beta-helix repeat-containing protein [Candidatus Levybacteria bacterium]
MHALAQHKYLLNVLLSFTLAIGIAAFLLQHIGDFPKKALAATGQTFYVSPSGNDTNPGTESQPFKTIQKGINVTKAGDVVIVKKGTYVPDGDYVARHIPLSGLGANGTSTAPITIKAEFPATEVGPLNRTILKGPGTEPGPKGFYLSGSQYIIIEGFEITQTYLGILTVNASNNIFRKNIFTLNTMAGVNLHQSNNNRIEYNQFLDPGSSATGIGYQDYGVAIGENANNNKTTHNYFFGRSHQTVSIKYASTDNYIAYNVFDGCMLTCVYLGQEDDKPGKDNTSSDITVEYNAFRDATDATYGYYRLRTPIAVRNTKNASIRYNYIENMYFAAIAFLPCYESTTPKCGAALGIKPTGAMIIGNTIVNRNPTQKWAAFEIIGRGYNGDIVELYNNTVYNNSRVLSVSNGPTSPEFLAIAETTAPPSVIITNNNFVNVGYNGEGAFLPTNYGALTGGQNTTTTTFTNNNWYELASPTTNYATGTDKHLNPKFVGPLTAYSPTTGPSPVYDVNQPGSSWIRALGYKYQSGSPLINAGVTVSGLTSPDGILDIGSNEWILNVLPPTPTATPVSIVGDINKDGRVDLLDFNIWRDEFLGNVTTKLADLNNDAKVDLLDFNLWLTAYKTGS